MSVYNRTPKEERERFLNDILEHYIERQGLGSMPKADFDALLIHLFLLNSDEEFDSFSLSALFKIKETRLKSLIETAAVKFEDRDIQHIWMIILKQWKSTITEVDNIESGEVRFKFENPAYFRYLQREVRKTEGTVKYDKSSEAATTSLSTLFHVLNNVHILLRGQTGNQAAIEYLIKKIKDDLIGTNTLKKIKDDCAKKLKLTQILTNASSLSSIGSIIKTIFFLA